MEFRAIDERMYHVYITNHLCKCFDTEARLPSPYPPEQLQRLDRDSGGGVVRLVPHVPQPHEIKTRGHAVCGTLNDCCLGSGVDVHQLNVELDDVCVCSIFSFLARCVFVSQWCSGVFPREVEVGKFGNQRFPVLVSLVCSMLPGAVVLVDPPSSLQANKNGRNNS